MATFGTNDQSPDYCWHRFRAASVCFLQKQPSHAIFSFGNTIREQVHPHSLACVPLENAAAMMQVKMIVTGKFSILMSPLSRQILNVCARQKCTNATNAQSMSKHIPLWSHKIPEGGWHSWTVQNIYCSGSQVNMKGFLCSCAQFHWGDVVTIMSDIISGQYESLLTFMILSWCGILRRIFIVETRPKNRFDFRFQTLWTWRLFELSENISVQLSNWFCAQ